MSENIQSIANGSFVLGNTNELTFSAGPGIKIDEPSEGVVRIGNDETVLWSGTVEYTEGQNLNVTIQLSESVLNFERIVVYCTGTKITMLQWSPTDNTGIVANYITSDTESNNFTVGAVIVQLADKTQIRYRCGYSQTSVITAYRGEYWDIYGRPYKVIGINRISGSNA